MNSLSRLLSLPIILSVSVAHAAHADALTLTPLGSLGVNNGSYLSQCHGVTNNGMVVGDAIASSGSDVAFMSTPAGGMVNIDTTGLGAGSASLAYGVSADGSVVVGTANFGNGNGYQNAFRWTQATGMVDIDTTGQGASSNSQAYGVSADGSAVVGQANFGTAYNAFRWTQATGMVNIDTTGQGANSVSRAYGVSADGSVVVGFAKFSNGYNYNAFRWTQATGMVDIDTTGQGASSDSLARGVSADGSVVVGQANFGNGNAYNAFRWTQATGMQNLNTLLSNAGVNMTGITLASATSISPNGNYIAANDNNQAYLVYYMIPSLAGSGGSTAPVIAGITTAAAVQQGTQQLANHQIATVIQSRNTANEILGMTRPIDSGNYVQSGMMFGSQVGYLSGQYNDRGFTLVGGIADGSEDYPDARQGGAVTPAVALRYTFDDPFGDEGGALRPYAELGSWATPEENLTMTRPYANGAGTSYGVGSTNAAAWAGYGRGGLISDIDDDDRLTTFGELGVQYLSYAGYGEALTSQNPFPASVNGGLTHMDITRLGTEWTRQMGALDDEYGDTIPVSLTFAGAVAHSFGVHAPMVTTVSGLGTTSALGQEATWGEIGTRVEARLTDELAVDLDISGTTGGEGIGTTMHGGGSISYKF